MRNGLSENEIGGLRDGNQHGLLNGRVDGLFTDGVYNRLCPEANRLISKMQITPPAKEAYAIDQFIKGLIKHDIWYRGDLLQVYAQGSDQAKNLNWLNPGTNTATQVNSPTFTPYKGITTNGSNQYIDTNWNILSNASKFANTSASHLVYSSTMLTSNHNGVYGFSNFSFIGYGLQAGYINNTSPDTYIGNSIGLCGLNRNGSAISGWVKGVNTVSTTAVANGAAFQGVTDTVGALKYYNGTILTYCAGTYALVWRGGSLTTEQHFWFNFLIEQYLRSFGNNLY